MIGEENKVISKLGGDLGIPLENQKKFEEAMIHSTDKEQISVLKHYFVDWAFLVHDFNRIHVFPEYAAEAGFKKIPIHGTLISAFEEQYALKILEVLKEFTGKELFYNNHRIKFETPIFPRFRKARAVWDLESATVDEVDISLNVSATDLKNQEKYISSRIGFGYKPNQEDPQKIIEFLSAGDIVHRTSMEIKEGERARCYNILGKKKIDEVLMMHVGAFTPATLLELSSRRTGRPEGAYREIDFDFYNPPQLGIFETILRMPKAPRVLPEGKGFFYKFEAICMQNKKLVLSGNVKCISPIEYKLN
ncbi:MAG: MaoC family dehydratase [Candidatus Pacearchaeota archaeon]|jgi:hypothetical protein